MIKIYKTIPPKWWNDFIEKNKDKPWNQINTKELKIYILNHEQKKYNRYFCCYCELPIDFSYSKPTIDHLKPVSKCPNLKLNYQNLIISCDSNKNCNNFKKNKWNENFINPVIIDPLLFLTYDIFSGCRVSKNKNDKNALYTIQTLNLNNNRLLNIRKNIFNFIIESLQNSNNKDYNKILNNLLPYIPKSIYLFFIENKNIFEKTITRLNNKEKEGKMC